MLMAPIGAGYLAEIRSVPGSTEFIDAGVVQLDNVPDDVNVFFGVCPRRASDRTVDVATNVWCDVDSTPPEWEEVGTINAVVPRPTAIVNSGRGRHLYWVLSEPIAAAEAVRLARLAVLAFKGDFACCEPKRVMRLPGTYNMKYSPKRPVELEHLGKKRYTAEDLEHRLLVAVVSPHWLPGARHELALALGAVLARADWTVERAKKLVHVLCKETHDGEEVDRQSAVLGSIERRTEGGVVSAAALRDALTPTGWRILLQGLGITNRDGDILYEGNVIGRKETIERDVVNLVLAEKRWAYAEGTLVRWSGTHWARATTEELMSHCFNLLAQMSIIQHGDARMLPPKAALARSISSVTSGSLMATIMDPMDPYSVPLENGVLDTRTVEISESIPEVRNRWVMPVEFDADATCPLWEGFIAEAAPDASSLLQEWAGYLLMGSNPWQRMLWLFGPSETGKSTFINAISNILGPSAVAISTDRIHEYTAASVADKRAAVCTEVPPTILRTPTLKGLVSGDPVVGRHPYGKPFTVAFGGKIVWASNTLPPVDQGEGLWRRIVVVPFTQVPKSIDPMLGRKLKDEISGILNWALVGLRRVLSYTDGDVPSWPLPTYAQDTVDEYRESADLFTQFAEEEFVFDAAKSEKSAEIYRRYSGWSKDRGLTPIPYGPPLWRELRRQGLSPHAKRVDGVLERRWLGASLREIEF